MSKEKIGFDPLKKILDLRRKEFPKTFPSQREIDDLPKKKQFGVPKEKWGPDIDKLERDTVGNIIINCLSRHIGESRKEGFYVNMIAEAVITAMEAKRRVNLKDKLLSFLVDAVDKQAIRKNEKADEKPKPGQKEEPEMIGTYAGWVIAQVLQELGVEED